VINAFVWDGSGLEGCGYLGGGKTRLLFSSSTGVIMKNGDAITGERLTWSFSSSVSILVLSECTRAWAWLVSSIPLPLYAAAAA